MALSVLGFRFAATAAGIRKDGRVDVALAAAEVPCVAAGLLTRNLVRAAPVVVAAERLKSGLARAVLVNSGTANACTGAAGIEATEHSTRAVAQALGVPESQVLPASTGVIGALLPAERIVGRASELVANLSSEGHEAFAQAICTTDRWTKVAHAHVPGPGGSTTLLGIGKGAGMIHPDVGPPQATMLVFLFSDARIARTELERALRDAADRTFNSASVDGSTSTNDSVLMLASGAADVELDARALSEPLFGVCDSLARSMVADGEGAKHAVEIRVRGLGSAGDARRIAQSVATSLLVKTALFGEDANWGRLLAAAGQVGVPFDPSRARIAVGDVEIVRDGIAVGADAERRASSVMTTPSYTIDLVLGSGGGEARYLTSDLGHGYVDVNAGYRS